MVPTPVGNLEDMTFRAISVLKKVSVILAEDTRNASVLTKHFDISTPIISHHKFNEHETVSTIVNRLKGGETIALITDAGTPGISDPGFLLSRECRENKIEVETLPGATAFVPALVNSGLPCDRFCFEGFLPPKKGRRTRLEILSQDPRTFIIYESPLRLVKTLKELAEVCGNERPASVSREISKIYNSTINGNLSELIEHFTLNQPKGEIVIIIGGKSNDGQPKVHQNKFRPQTE